jgi:hypothetical protein
MSRVFFKKYKSKHFSIPSSSVSDISASELSYLKAEVWSLQNHLRQEKISNRNLAVSKIITLLNQHGLVIFLFKESYRKLASEKYELLEELTRQNISIKKLHEELDQERLYRKFGNINHHTLSLDIYFSFFLFTEKSTICLSTKMKHCRRILIKITSFW